MRGSYGAAYLSVERTGKVYIPYLLPLLSTRQPAGRMREVSINLNYCPGLTRTGLTLTARVGSLVCGITLRGKQDVTITKTAITASTTSLWSPFVRFQFMTLKSNCCTDVVRRRQATSMCGWVYGGGGVLTIVWVFWQYVYLYLLYCVLFVLFRLCIFILICLVCTSVRTTAAEWKFSCSNNNSNYYYYSKTCLKRNAIVPVLFFRFHRFPFYKGLCFNKTKYKKYDRLEFQWRNNLK
jgi:hypothetical protein